MGNSLRSASSRKSKLDKSLKKLFKDYAELPAIAEHAAGGEHENFEPSLEGIIYDQNKTNGWVSLEKMTEFGYPDVGKDEIHFASHSMCWNQFRRNANWVLEMIDNSNFKKAKDIEQPHIKVFPIKNLEFGSKMSDFLNYDLINLVNPELHKNSQEAYYTARNLCNMVPMPDKVAHLDLWDKLNTFTESLFKKWNVPRAWITSGPAYVPTNFYDVENEGRLKYYLIGESLVAIPTHLYKAYLVQQGGKRYLGCFLIPNQQLLSGESIWDYQIKRSELELLIGFLIFPDYKEISREAENTLDFFNPNKVKDESSVSSVEHPLALIPTISRSSMNVAERKSIKKENDRIKKLIEKQNLSATQSKAISEENTEEEKTEEVLVDKRTSEERALQAAANKKKHEKQKRKKAEAKEAARLAAGGTPRAQPLVIDVHEEEKEEESKIEEESKEEESKEELSKEEESKEEESEEEESEKEESEEEESEEEEKGDEVEIPKENNKKKPVKSLSKQMKKQSNTTKKTSNDTKKNTRKKKSSPEKKKSSPEKKKSSLEKKKSRIYITNVKEPEPEPEPQASESILSQVRRKTSAFALSIARSGLNLLSHYTGIGKDDAIDTTKNISENVKK